MKIFIPHILPGLNEIIAANRKHRMAGAAQKKKWTGLLTAIFRTHGHPITCPVYIEFIWIEKNRRRDPDNIAAGGRKFILDAMVQSGILENDGWNQISGWNDRFKVNKKNPGVIVKNKIDNSKKNC